MNGAIGISALRVALALSFVGAIALVAAARRNTAALRSAGFAVV